jgi:hypothetical protein
MLRISNSYYAAPRNHINPRLTNDDFKKQFSSFLLLEKWFSNRLNAKIQLGIDKGERIQNTYGISISTNYQIR